MSDKSKMYEIAWDYDDDIHILASEETSGLPAEVLQKMEDNVKKMYNEEVNKPPPPKDYYAR